MRVLRDVWASWRAEWKWWRQATPKERWEAVWRNGGTPGPPF
jgi:hypothetical protein